MEEEPELRPLPPSPQRRGIPLGDGNYTGCAYGYGDVAPFTGPRDCLSVMGRGSKAPSKQFCRIQTLAIRTAAAA